MKKKYLLILIGILILPINVLATSGWLTSSSIVSCNGQYYGSHGDGHWHIAEKRGTRWYAEGSPLNGNPCNGPTSNNNNSSNSNYNNAPKTVEPTKSSDSSLKELKINDENIEISNSMLYETKLDKITVEAIANDDKATIEYEKEKNLEVGINEYTIKVTAENGTATNYRIDISRVALSDNKNFKLFYNKKELTINYFNKTIETIEVNDETTKIDFTYELAHENAKIEFVGNENLKVGENTIQVVITSEDNTNETYTIMVRKESGSLELVVGLIAIMIIAFPVIGICMSIYFIIKRRKENENRNEKA